jgi:beta-lactamase superfamily II metal-dependent hydrolase
MLSLEMLPAGHGDCLWIEYGEPVHRILIDGGPHYTYPHLRSKIALLPKGERRFELLIVTHVDADHIEGLLRLLQDSTLGVTFGDVWFNGATQINEALGAPDQLDERQGEYLQALLTKSGQTWNGAFDGKMIHVPDTGELPTATLAGKATLTVVSPMVTELRALHARWLNIITKEGFRSGDTARVLEELATKTRLKPLEPGDMLGQNDLPAGRGEADDPPGGDRAVANGSSIAVIFEYGGHRLLLTGDAFPGVLTASLKRVDNGTRLDLALFKLPHHGSIGNITDEMIHAVNCEQFAISTNGSYFEHPNARAIDTLLNALPADSNPRLWFNYLSEQTEPWCDPDREKSRMYAAEHPPKKGHQGIKVSFP